MQNNLSPTHNLFPDTEKTLNFKQNQLTVKYFSICHDCKTVGLNILVQLLKNLYTLFSNIQLEAV